MQKRLIIGTLGLFFFLVMIATSMVVGRFLISQAGWGASPETHVAHFEKDQAAFVRQIQANSGEYVENAGMPVFDNQVVLIPPPRVAPEASPRVLGTETASDELEKWIEVDLSEQQLTTWAGKQKLKEYPVSTGLSGTPTVQGEFRVWRKVLSQGYRGGSKAKGNYYYLPNVPYSLFFHKGYAIHAAYWHNDFGIRPRSHGCVNMRTADAKEVYEWANPVMPIGLSAFNADETNAGTRIVIHG